VGRVGSRHFGFPCFPYSVISMACFRPAMLDKPPRQCVHWRFAKPEFLPAPSTFTCTNPVWRNEDRLNLTCRDARTLLIFSYETRYRRSSSFGSRLIRSLCFARKSRVLAAGSEMPVASATSRNVPSRASRISTTLRNLGGRA
jgi:hypothetical protein